MVVQVYRDNKTSEPKYENDDEESEICNEIRRAINETTEVGKRGFLRVGKECFRANAEFDATFSATWRRYVYIIP